MPVRSSHPGSSRASLYAPIPVLLRIEFTATDSSQPSGALLPHLSTLTGRHRPQPAIYQRYISVALFLKSPSAGVTRYPCPVEPGLSSRPAFRPGRATVCLTRLSILPESGGIVNAWPQCGLHIGGSRQGLPLKIPDGPQTQLGPGFMAPQPWEKKSGKGRGVVVFFSDLRYNFLVCQSLPPSAALGAYP